MIKTYQIWRDKTGGLVLAPSDHDTVSQLKFKGANLMDEKNFEDADQAFEWFKSQSDKAFF